MGRKGFLLAGGERRLKRFLRELRAASRDPGEETVHDLRVAVRRLLAWHALAAALSGTPPSPAPLPGALARLMRPLGRLRDAHVKARRLLAFAPEADPVAWRYALSLSVEIERCEAEVGKALRAARPSAFRAAFDALDPSTLATGALAGPALAELGAREGEVVLQAGEYAADPGPRRLHVLRLAFKRYRYTAEALSALLPGLTPDAGGRLHDFQTLLGDIHDFDVLLAEVGRFRVATLGLPGPECALELAVREARAESSARVDAILSSGKGIAGLFASR
jgi:CHAD domain-containing protein